MDDLEDKNNGNTNSAGDSHQSPPDPIGQTSGDPVRPHKKVQSAEIIHNAKMPISVADATLLPNQFMGTGGGMQAVPSVGDIIESMLRFKWTYLYPLSYRCKCLYIKMIQKNNFTKFFVLQP